MRAVPHAGTGPSTAARTRRAKNKDDCVACHMPRFSSTDIAHTAVTDHRVLRTPKGKTTAATEPVVLAPWQSPLVLFHQKQLPAGQELKRELGIVLAQVG